MTMQQYDMIIDMIMSNKTTEQENIERSNNVIAEIEAAVFKKEINNMMEELDRNIQENGIIDSGEEVNTEMAITKHKVALDIQEFDRKPSKEVPAIQNRIYYTSNRRELTIRELAEEIAIKGKTFKAGHMNDKTEKSYVRGSLLVLDIDNGEWNEDRTLKVRSASKKYITIEAALKRCRQLAIKPALVYETFSSNDKCVSFRLIFQVDKAMTYNEAEKLYKAAQAAFDGYNVDTTVGPGKLIYGGNRGIHLLNENAAIEYAKMTKFAPKKVPQSTGTAKVGASVRNTLNKDVYITPLFTHNLNSSYTEVIARLEGHFSLSNFVINGPYKSRYAAIQALKTINLAELLNVTPNRSIQCILCDDKHPSAAVHRLPDGTWLYTCHKCSHTYNLIELVATLLCIEGTKEQKYTKATNWLIEKAGIEITNTEEYQVHQDLLKHNRIFMANYEEHTADYNKVATQIKRNYSLLSRLLFLSEYAADVIGEATPEGKMILFTSYPTLMDHIGVRSVSTVQRRIDSLVTMGLINKVPDHIVEECAPELFKEAKRQQYNNGYDYCSTFYTINLWDDEAIIAANESLNAFRQAGATKQSATKATYDALGIDARVKSTSTINNKNLDYLISWARKTLNRKGCFTKEAYLVYAKKGKIGVRYAEDLLPTITTTLGTTRITISKKDIEKYSLPKNSLRKTAFTKNKNK